MEFSQQSKESAPQAGTAWRKLCRFSLYFMIFGAAFSIVRYKMAMNVVTNTADRELYSEQAKGLTDYLATYFSTFYYLCGFTLLSLTLFIISLIMLRRCSS